MTINISNSNLCATINTQGAELQSLQNVKSKQEYIWAANPDYWGKHSPVLFPIVGALKNDSYYYNGKTYELPRHGFARDFEFQVKSHQTKKVVFYLQSNTTTKQVFPFEFELLLTYLLLDSELQITYAVINHSAEVMPFSIGGHPAFALNASFESYSLQFEADESLSSYLLENNLISNKTKKITLQNNELPLTYSLFENDALILKSLQSKQIKILENGIPFLNFKFNDFPHFGIWTKMNAPFICLEPWVGYADTIHTNGNIMEKEGIQFLEGNSEKEYRFSIEIL